jgi:6-phosphogluconate dehydrogenase
MDIGMIGLGRMGFNMTLRLLKGGHRVVAFDRAAAVVDDAKSRGATRARTVAEVVDQLPGPRALWAMVPAGAPVDGLVEELAGRLGPGDVFVDGGNSNYKDSVRRHGALAARGIQFVDAGVSGGVWGLEVGYCMMLGGEAAAVARLKPALDTLAPPEGWRHVGGPGAGHFAKMIHNGIEYGMMESYAEGFEILHASDYRYDLAALAQLWNRGSVVRSWLLELAGRAFEADPELASIRGYVEDSGEGRWTVMEAIDRSIPAPVLALSLLTRFRSRQQDSFRDKVLAALRHQFGGHAVKARE